MKKLALRLIIFIVLIFAINYLLGFFLPFAWGAPDLEAKYEYYRERAGSYDTLFIGSSRFYRQISPATFDGIVSDAKPLQSFNLGVSAFPAPQPFWLYEHILKDNPEQLKYVLLEISPLGDLPPANNLHTRRFVYWYNLKHTILLIRSVLNSDEVLLAKLKYSGIHIMTLLEKYFNANLLDVYKRKVKLMYSEMEGKTAAICGADCGSCDGARDVTPADGT